MASRPMQIAHKTARLPSRKECHLPLVPLGFWFKDSLDPQLTVWDFFGNWKIPDGLLRDLIVPTVYPIDDRGVLIIE